MAGEQAAPKDPIQTGSLSKPIFIASLLMLISLLLAFYDEFWGRRPYKDYQMKFRVHYLNFLDRHLPEQRAKLAAIVEDPEAHPEYAALEAELQAAIERHAPRNAEIDEELTTIVEPNVANLNLALKNVRAEYSAYMYLLETEKDEGELANIRTELDRIRKGPYPLEQIEDGETVTHSCDFDELKRRHTEMVDRKTELERERAELAAPVSEIRKQLDAYIGKHLDGLHPDAVVKLIEKVENEDTLKGIFAEIKQIHVSEIDWVDRCESCHVGTREPVDMVADDMNGEMVFASHPTRELLAIHDPEQFGCSMCHNGNGRSVTTVKYAHGLNKHWLYPLFDNENYEAGCVQCHMDDLKLEHGPDFNHGKWLFQHKGCWGCHPYERFDKEPAQIAFNKKEIERLGYEMEKLEVERSVVKADQLPKIDLAISGLETKIAELAEEKSQLEMEVQKVGPNLANVKSKLKADFLIPWLLDPVAFRPSTKMPSFRLNQDEATAIAAYLWQAANADAPQKHAAGDPARGKDLFTKKGCLGCHTMEMDGKTMGDGFAADLSRIGDKANYDFVVEWIKQPTSGIMPSLGLSWEECRDIASYLMSRKQGTDWQPTLQQLEDKTLYERGANWIRHNGCAGCHTIPGMEKEGKIGTDLTVEGTKPKERLDFGRIEHDYKVGKIQKLPLHDGSGEHVETTGYKHKAFFLTKLSNPDWFEQGRVIENRDEHLRMPNFRLDRGQLNSLTTFLLGSMESEIPQTFRYNPDEQQKAIQEGWWIVKKYNCVGCHQLEADVTPALWDMDLYTGQGERPDGSPFQRKDYRPPSLVGQGLRTDPDWLATFLRNPSLSETEQGKLKNGVREYLDIRMPEFRMSDREIAKLVRFFGALSSQPIPYIPPKVQPLDDQELAYARDAFKGVACVKCHAIGDPAHDALANAPSLTLTGGRLKSTWLDRWLVNPQALMPGTNMPANFTPEWEITLSDNRVVVGTNWDRRAGTLKLADGSTTDVSTYKGKPVIRRYIVEGYAKGYDGDHRELISRYLSLHYNEAEIPFGMPDQ